MPDIDPQKALPSGALIVGKERVADTSLGMMDHVNPATGRIQSQFSIAGPDEVDAAVEAAREALEEWSKWSIRDRRDTLLRLADLIEANGDELAIMGALENGTPMAFSSFATSFVPADWFRYYAGWVDKLDGRQIPGFQRNTLDYTILEPLGVVAVFTAFNAPASFVGMKVAPALAAGNAVVLKPSELAPWTSLRMGELCLEAGLPPGVVNVLPGDARGGQALASHPGIDKVTFTGSARTARAILAAAAESLTPVTLELGGKSASVIFADANLDLAITTALQGGLIICSGQACAAGTRLLVQREIYDEVVDTVASVTSDEIVGDPFEPGVMMGPVISEYHCNRILGVIEEAKRENMGELLVGGGRLGGELADGYFIQPTVFTGVDPASSLAQEEVFGPVLSIIPFDDEEDALRISNASKYGLAGFIFTRDVNRAHRFAAAMDTGYVSINTFNPIPANAPFGGVKGSGFGREGGYDGIKEMTRTKNVALLLD